jgi:hypothetical protein
MDEVDCLAAGYTWNNPLDMGHFDHVPAALLIMFELGTQENWNRLMYAAIDARKGLHWVVCIIQLYLTRHHGHGDDHDMAGWYGCVARQQYVGSSVFRDINSNLFILLCQSIRWCCC